jgi:hypothetical protein
MSSLSIQNACLTEMLKQAGLDVEARDVAQRIQSVLTDEIRGPNADGSVGACG